MRKAIRTAIVLGVIATILGGCGHRSANSPSGAAGQKKVPLVEVAPVQVGDIARVLQTTGTVVSANEIQVSPKVEQRIIWLIVREGDRVTRGQVLARLDTTELEAQTRQAQAEVRVAQARLRDAEAGSRVQEIRGAEAAVRQAEAQLASARSAAEDAGRDVERQRQLLAIGGASQQEVDHAQTRYEAARSQVEATEAALTAARERLGLLREGAAQTQLALAREQVAQARDKLAYWQAQAQFYVIRSPLSGVVTRVYQHTGDLASPKAPVLAIADTSQTIVRTSVTDTEAARLRLGQPVKVEVDALPGSDPFSLRITRIYPAADAGSQLVAVEIAAPMLAGKVKEGSLARLSVILEKRTGTVVVPAHAIVARPNGKLVALVVRDGKSEERSVQTGIETGDRVEVVSGLRPGEQLIVRGQERLKGGVEVKVKPPKGDKAPGGGK
jgi:multidrug efflux pump subunit AcrA (membrane-fusion protein)